MSGRIKSKKVLFLIRLVFFFAFFYLLWYYLSPFYNELLAGVSEGVIRLSEIGRLKITQSIIGAEKHILLYHIPEGSPVTKFRGNLVHFDMVLLFALIWAVPHINWKKRMKIFLLGFAIVFVLHQFKIFVFVKRDYSIHIMIDGVPYWSLFEKKAYQYLHEFIVLVVNQIAPILIWSLLYVKYWWGKGLRLGTQ